MDILRGIHETNDYEKSLFGAKRIEIGENISCWYSDLRPDQVNNNFFEMAGDVRPEEIARAIELQKKRNLSYIMIRTNCPLCKQCKELYQFQEDITYVMAMLTDKSYAWKTNSSVEIRDIQHFDLSSDLMDVSSVPEEYRDMVRRNMQMVLEVAKQHPEYQWLCAYQDGARAGEVYALSYKGFTEIDDLWVKEECRNQYIATTLLKYIADHTEGILYLHADAGETPKDMYAKMGFKVIETIYEYYLEW